MSNTTGEVWTLAEVRDKEIHPVSRELLAWGRELADDLGVPLASVVIGSGIEDKAKNLASYGADKVYFADEPEFENFKPDIVVTMLEELTEKYMPSVLIASATTQGRTVMPMLSARLGCGLTADCTEMKIDEKSKRLIQTRPAIGGNVMADIKTKGRDPQMCTVRPKSKRPLMCDPSLIILDEPAGGLNDSETERLTELIRGIARDRHCAILLVEHDMKLVMSLCDRICAISFGKKLAEGTAAEIQQNPLVQDAYLGKEDEA